MLCKAIPSRHKSIPSWFETKENRFTDSFEANKLQSHHDNQIIKGISAMVMLANKKLQSNEIMVVKHLLTNAAIGLPPIGK